MREIKPMDITISNEVNDEEESVTSRNNRRRKYSDRPLRIIFLICIALIGIVSFSIALIIGSVFVQFKQQCLLYATFDYQLFITRDSNWTVRITPLTERFSSQSLCDFCTFFNVFTFIYCIMTSFFFLLFNGDHRILATNDRCLIVPWFPISLILTIFSIISASLLTDGFLKFCSSMKSNGYRVSSCTVLNQLYFEQYPTVSTLYFYMVLSIIGSWFQLICFIGILGVLTIRISSAFNVRMDYCTNPAQESIDIGMKFLEQT